MAKFSKHERNRVLALYARGKNSREIAAITGLGGRDVITCLHSYGLATNQKNLRKMTLQEVMELNRYIKETDRFRFEVMCADSIRWQKLLSQEPAVSLQLLMKKYEPCAE